MSQRSRLIYAGRTAAQPADSMDVFGRLSFGTLRHVVVLNEEHLRRLLREYVDYYNDERVHTSIADAPNGRAMESRPSDSATIIGFPRVGGLHHRYAWREAA